MTSKNFLPPPPSYLTLANSASASLARFSLAVRTWIAGFCEGSGKICCDGLKGLVEESEPSEEGKREELDSVEDGVTGPSERREAAK